MNVPPHVRDRVRARRTIAHQVARELVPIERTVYEIEGDVARIARILGDALTEALRQRKEEERLLEEELERRRRPWDKALASNTRRVSRREHRHLHVVLDDEHLHVVIEETEQS